MTTSKRSRWALTLLELLVVIAIIAILLGLLLPAVQQVRGTAARIACTNNLKQLALAAHNYSAANNTLPPGVTADDPSTPYPYMGWVTRLLPYMDQAPLWDQIISAYGVNRRFLHPPLVHPTDRPLRVAICPADPRAGDFLTPQPGGWLTRVALCSYMGVNGTNGLRQNGALVSGVAIRLTDVTDGTSSTLLVGERPPTRDGFYGWWYASPGIDGRGTADILLGAAEREFGTPYGCDAGPHRFAPGQLSVPCDVLHFWSTHPGGANFAFADGSVRFLRYSAAGVLPALATRAGGEVVPGDF